MRRLVPAASLLADAACRSHGVLSPSAGAALAIRHVTVVDATGAPARLDQTVLILGNRITAIASDAEVGLRPGTRVVEASGKYLIPGLWDMHSHVTGFGPTSLPLYLANGVTGIRDMGAERFATAKAWRDSITAVCAWKRRRTRRGATSGVCRMTRSTAVGRMRCAASATAAPRHRPPRSKRSARPRASC